jgi:pilus assembly protein CpaE
LHPATAGGHDPHAPTRRAEPEVAMPAKILVVDDDPNVQRLLASTLKHEGYEVIASPDGSDALRKWETVHPDLILLDADLPRVDGYQVLARIRSEEGSSAHVPVIMLTAQADIGHKVRALRSGADDHQVKPFHAAELLARIRSLLARFAPRERLTGRPPLGRVHVYYGAKGGVGTTTIAINAGIALQREIGRKVALVDGNLQFGDHRVFLDLGVDRRSIVDAVSATSIDQELLRSVIVRHDSGVDVLLAPPSPEAAEHVRPEEHHMSRVLELLRSMYDYIVVDIDKRLDETNLDVISAADVFFVVMTADLSCLKNVRLVVETMSKLGMERSKVQLVLNRSNAFTGINVKHAEAALKRRIDFQIVNEYRGAMSSLNSGLPFMLTRPDSVLGRSVLDFAKSADKLGTERSSPQQLALPATT